jgi:hypothetical protein
MTDPTRVRERHRVGRQVCLARRFGALALLVGTVAVAARLPAGSVRAAPASVSPPTPAPPSAATAADLLAVDATYTAFWALAQTLDTYPESRWPALLAAVAVEPATTWITELLRGRVAAGYQQYGAVIAHPAIVYVVADRVSIVDCQDAGRSGEVDLRTGLPRGIGSPRTLVGATISRSPAGTWRVSAIAFLDGNCTQPPVT